MTTCLNRNIFQCPLSEFPIWDVNFQVSTSQLPQVSHPLGTVATFKPERPNSRLLHHPNYNSCNRPNSEPTLSQLHLGHSGLEVTVPRAVGTNVGWEDSYYTMLSVGMLLTCKSRELGHSGSKFASGTPA